MIRKIPEWMANMPTYPKKTYATLDAVAGVARGQIVVETPDFSPTGILVGDVWLSVEGARIVADALLQFCADCAERKAGA